MQLECPGSCVFTVVTIAVTYVIRLTFAAAFVSLLNMLLPVHANCATPRRCCLRAFARIWHGPHRPHLPADCYISYVGRKTCVRFIIINLLSICPVVVLVMFAQLCRTVPG